MCSAPTPGESECGAEAVRAEAADKALSLSSLRALSWEGGQLTLGHAGAGGGERSACAQLDVGGLGPGHPNFPTVPCGEDAVLRGQDPGGFFLAGPGEMG